MGPIEVRGYRKVGRWWSVRFGVDFTMPAVPFGSYRIDVCTKPCKRTIEELYPTVTRVVSGPLEERIEERFADRDGALYEAMHAGDNRIERRAKRGRYVLRDYTRKRFARQTVRIDELAAALQSVRRAASEKPFPTGLTAIAFAVRAIFATAGWFFSPKVAQRATLSKKKKTSALGGAA